MAIALKASETEEARQSAATSRVRRYPSVKWTIFRAMLVFTGVIVVLLWLCQVVFLDSIYKMIKIHELERDASLISARIDTQQLEKQAEILAHRDEICMIGLKMQDNDTGYALFSYCVNPECALHDTDKDAKFVFYDAAVQNGGRAVQRYRYDSRGRCYYPVNDNLFAQTNDAESIVLTFVVENQAGEQIAVILNSVISPVSATVNTLNSLLSIITVILILLALLLAWIISRSIAAPIVSLNETAKALAARDYSVHFDERGYREVSELGATLNYATGELSKVDSLCRELIANISHDLRTPLTMIRGYAEVMRDLPGENTPENVQVIIDEANRLTTLVNDVLDVDSFRGGRQKFVCEPFCLTEAVRESIRRYSKLMEQKGYRLRFDAEEEIWVDSDQVRIMQVLYNLINNAITYTGEDHSVTLTQRRMENGMVRIEVTDTGEGIPADKIGDIWERYYRVDKVHKRAAVGSGLGLSIVKSIIDMAHGRCGVRSTPGCGSTFWFELTPVPAPDAQ